MKALFVKFFVIKHPQVQTPSLVNAYPNCMMLYHQASLHWRHNERHGVSNHQPHDCLLNLYSGADQRKHKSSVSLAFVRGIRQQIPRIKGQ